MRLKVKIRPMQKGDIDDVRSLALKTKELDAGTGWYSKERLKGWLKNPFDVLLVAEIEGQIVGFVLSRFHKESAFACMEEIAIVNKYRGYGIGSKLWDGCLKKLKKKRATYIYSLVRINNLKMLSFLKKRGFKKGKAFYWMFEA